MVVDFANRNEMEHWVSISKIYETRMLSKQIEDVFGQEVADQLESSKGDIDFDADADLEATSTKIIRHYGQNYLAGRFQHYSDDWKLKKNHEAELIPLDQIEQVPITMIFGSEDYLTNFETEKEQIALINPDLLTVKWLDGYDHFVMGSGMSDADVELVIQALMGELTESDEAFYEFLAQQSNETEQ